MIPIFIGGTGRSGTSILKRLVARHPEVASIPVELRVIVDPGGAIDLKAALTDDWSPYKADYALHEFRALMMSAGYRDFASRTASKFSTLLGASPERYHIMQLGDDFGEKYYKERLDRLINDLIFYKSTGRWIGSRSYEFSPTVYEADPQEPTEVSKLIAQFFHDLFRQRAGRTKATHWIDDTPYNLIHAAQLLELFPNMRFVHIYRDWRDVLASYLGQNWGGDSAVATARRLHNILARWFSVRSSLPDTSYMEVSLEQLASSSGEWIMKVFQFLELDASALQATDLAMITPGRVNAGRWKSDLSEERLDVAFQYLEPFMKSYGYE